MIVDKSDVFLRSGEPDCAVFIDVFLCFEEVVMMTVCKENVLQISVILYVHPHVHTVVAGIDDSLEACCLVCDQICVFSIHPIRIANDINSHEILLILV